MDAREVASKIHNTNTHGCGSKSMVPFWVGAPPILVYFSDGWDVHWGYGILTHGHMIVLYVSLLDLNPPPRLQICPP